MVLDRLQKTVGSFRMTSFRGTGGSSERTATMYRELQRYAGHFKAMEKETQRWQGLVQGTFTSISNVMCMPLPKTYEENHDGQAIPTESENHCIGDGVNVDALQAAGNSHVVNLDQVLRITQSWLAEFRDVQTRMKTLDAIRADLDARNRRVQSLRAKIDQTRTRLQTAKSGTNLQRDEALLVDSEHQLETAIQNVQGVQQNFHETEQETYEAQIVLAKKCPRLHECAMKLITTCQTTFRGAYDAFAVGSYGMGSSYQSINTGLDKSLAGAYPTGDAGYQAYGPQSPASPGYHPTGDGHQRNISYGDSEGHSYSQQPNQYGWGAPKPDNYSIESDRHLPHGSYPKINF